MRYATTYIAPWQPSWARGTTPVSVDRIGPHRALGRLIRHGGPAILNGAVSARRGYIDLWATAILRRRGATVLLADATWEPGSRRIDRALGQAADAVGYDRSPIPRKAIRSGLMRLIDGPQVHYAVLSTSELDTFPALWGVDRDRVHFVPFSATTRDNDTRSQGGGGVFAGGNSLRDYRALLDAAPRIRAPLTVATMLPVSSSDGARVGPVPQQEYNALADAADVVVVPLLAGTVRSAGQQTYLNAMLRGQAVVVTEAPGVRDYIEDGETGRIVPNDKDALADVINELIASPEARRRLGEAARADVLRRFTLSDYYERLLETAQRITPRMPR